MDRRAIPLIGMISYGENRLREAGFVASPLRESFVLDPQRLRPHYHDFFQVTLMKGAGKMMHDFREAKVSGSTMFFLSPGQVHTIVPGSKMEGTIVSFTREFIDPGATGFLTDLPFYFAVGGMPWLRIKPRHVAWVEAAFTELQEEFDRGEAGAAEVFRSLLRIVFVKAARWHAVESPVEGAARPKVLVRAFLQEVEKRHRQWTTLEPYAKALGITVNHLNDMVRDETGIAAGEHVRSMRLLDAKRLLLHSSLSVSEIGYELGFEDPSYFSRFFKRYENVTPAGFRSRIREKYQKGID